MLRKYNDCGDKRKVVTALRILMDRFEPTRLRSFPLRDVLIRTSKTASGKYVEAVRVQILLWANHSNDTTPPYASPRPKKSSGATDSIANDMSQNTSDIVKANARKLWTWTCNACSYVVFECQLTRIMLIIPLTSITPRYQKYSNVNSLNLTQLQIEQLKYSNTGTTTKYHQTR